MKGIIFNLVEEVVSNEYGADTWDVLLAHAGVDGAYTSLGSYPDDDLHKLVVAASEALDTPADDVVRTIGAAAMPMLAERYPEFFEGHDCRGFLLTLNDIIHPEVRKLYPGADVPDFSYDASTDDRLVIGYRSPRKLCALAEGFILGAATHYGESVELAQDECMLNGGDRCLIAVTFGSAR